MDTTTNIDGFSILTFFLFSYTDLECPTAIDVHGDEMQLTEISFYNEARYMVDDSLLTIRDIERINALSRGTEYNVSKIDNQCTKLLTVII